MANKTLFQTTPGKILPKTDTINEAGGTAYAFEKRHALAQYATTGCLNGTFYASAETQLDTILKLCQKVDPEFIAKTAVYAREKGFMKDLPALLCASLAVRSPEMLTKIFNRVIDNGRMVRNFVQIIRSGVVGRKSLGSLPKRLVRNWIENRSDEQLFRDSVGNAPSLADIVKMVHPKPQTPQREALFGYLIGREHNAEALPFLVQEFEDFKRVAREGKMSETIPDVPFQMLTSLNLDVKQWTQIAKNASWQTTRMNLNTFARHGVFDGGAKIIGLKRILGFTDEMSQLIAERLRNPEQIARSRVFPYQLMTAYMNTDEGVPKAVRNALQDAMEIATQNVPEIPGKVYVFPDVSGSMHSPVTGSRKGGTSKVRCIDVAALVAAAVLRRNPDAEVIPFSDHVVSCKLNSRDSIMTNAEKLASLPSGGTNCSAPLKFINDQKKSGDLIVYVSDNESWIDSRRGNYGYYGPTATMKEWNTFKARSPNAKMVCIDIQPYASTQAQESPDIVNVGGFSDQVFTLIAEVAAGAGENHWINTIEKIEL